MSREQELPGSRKSELVLSVLRGAATRAEVCSAHGITEDQFDSWCQAALAGMRQALEAGSMAPSRSLADFAGKGVIVTGAASGIGRAMALGFARRGAGVLAVDVVESEEVAGVRGAAANIAFQRVEVTSGEDLRAGVDACIRDFGAVDVLVNNAGITRAAPLHEVAEEAWDLVLSVDLKAVYLGCKAVLPHMMSRGGGAIVNTASTLGLIANHNLSAYVAAKSGVVGLTRQIGLDYARYGVRCNCICPGPTETPNVVRSYGDPGSLTGRGQYLIDSVPLGRMAQPEEIAAAAIFLASDEASFVNAAALVVDGGHSVHTGPVWTDALFAES